MAALAGILVLAVAVIHVGIAIVEMFLWMLPKVHEGLGYNEVQAAQVAPIVKNAGLYNGFIAAGLFWGLYLGAAGYAIQVFFLICVIVAGIFGAATLKPRVFLVQSVPAFLALIVLWMSHRAS